MASDWRWSTGHITKATIEGASSYLIVNEAVQSDQNLLKPWTIPDDRLTTFPSPERIVQMLDGSSAADGEYTFQIGFAYLTEGQLKRLDTKFTWSDTIWSSAATLKVRLATGDYGVYQVTLHRPRPNQDYRRSNRGVEEVILRCTNGVLIVA